jgi:hypothetical protein
MPTVPPSMGLTIISLDLPLVAALDITERERRATYTQLDQQGKV